MFSIRLSEAKENRIAKPTRFEAGQKVMEMVLTCLQTTFPTTGKMFIFFKSFCRLSAELKELSYSKLTLKTRPQLFKGGITLSIG